MFDIIAKGGYVIVVIMVCSLGACAVIIERWFFYRAADKAAREFMFFLQDPSADLGTLQGTEKSVFEKMWETAATIPSTDREARQGAADDAVRTEIPVLETQSVRANHGGDGGPAAWASRHGAGHDQDLSGRLDQRPRQPADAGGRHFRSFV